MASKLTRADVLRVAELAHLELAEDEVELFTRQLAEILAYADDVQQVDTTGVSPTLHGLAPETSWREDEPTGSLDRGELLAGAPDADRAAGLFRVPKVL